KTKGDIRGKNPSQESFKVSKDGGEIDAITASTITSRAFIASIKSAYKAFEKYQEQSKQ
ncbi:MAG: FMN-binding protein, partial [Bacteroidales bacterium]|nr:FMN-binding protein [Bacteroidales bacterium]